MSNLFAKPSEVTVTSDELVDEFVILQPKETVTIKTEEWGSREATVTRVFKLDGSDVVDAGTTLIFWQAVRSQLQSCTPEQPVMAGYIERHHGKDYRYFRLTQRTPDSFDADAVSTQLAELL